MMYKLLLVFCLCACAFGYKCISSEFPSCAFHLKVAEGNADGDYYGIILDYSLFIIKNVSADNSYDLFRCDKKDEDGRCYATFYRPNDPDNRCRHEWAYVYSDLLPFNRYSFCYNDNKYPKTVKCADGSDCNQYCDYEDETDCVIADADGFFVQRNGMSYTLLDAPDMNVFKDDQCDDPSSPLPAPHNLCETVKQVNSVIPECSFHVKVEGWETREYYGVHGEHHYPYYMKVVKGDDYHLCRRDVSAGNSFYVKEFENDVCTDEEGIMYTPNWRYSYMYDSVSYPKDVKCPDGSDGCKLYCLDMTEHDCVTVDTAGHFVKTPDEVWTFYDAPPMSVFEDDTCEDPKQHLPAPVDICQTRKLISPNLEFDCTFHMTFGGSFRKRSEDNFELYGLISNGNVTAIKYISEGFSAIARGDIKNDEGLIYVQSIDDGECFDGYDDSDVFDELNEMLPEPFWYDSSNYPVPIKCPDGSDGCNQYCILPTSCIVVDTAGRFIQVESATMTYHEAPSLDVFAVDTCKGEHFAAPSATVCSGGHSSAPAPVGPSATSTPAVSSASIVKSAFTFVALLIVVVLL